ncbi:hypothetical protein VNO77_02671 [Canavalia gladiata]|uniref:Uncharacterized protein n=1 Tax=Canavalia gladiata TaxID=3824 RepID=A0AAN9R647_CANGL
MGIELLTCMVERSYRLPKRMDFLFPMGLILRMSFRWMARNVSQVSQIYVINKELIEAIVISNEHDIGVEHPVVDKEHDINVSQVNNYASLQAFEELYHPYHKAVSLLYSLVKTRTWTGGIILEFVGTAAARIASNV